MKTVKIAALALLCSPAVALAAESAASSQLQVPGLMTPAGQKFARLCSDASFASAADPRARHDRCARLLAQWQLEADRRSDRLVDADTGKPGFLSLRGIPRHPSL